MGTVENRTLRMRMQLRPRWRATIILAPVAAANLLLAGCTVAQSPASGVAHPAIVPPGFTAVIGDGAANVLDTAPAGATIRLHDVPVLTLGPQYNSARGLLCRTGWPIAHGEAEVYAFCRAADGWYAVSPVVIGRS